MTEKIYVLNVVQDTLANTGLVWPAVQKSNNALTVTKMAQSVSLVMKAFSILLIHAILVILTTNSVKFATKLGISVSLVIQAMHLTNKGSVKSVLN